MNERPHALRIGLFALLGLLLLGAAIVGVLGVQIFKSGERAVMHFPGSVYGLQVGGPVVFRGVRVGTVRSIGIGQAGDRLAVPVQVEMDQDQLRALSGPVPGSPLRALLMQGLSAQLATQSLLTGQLYVDLDFRASKNRVSTQAVASSVYGVPEIPTNPTRFQSLEQVLDKLDLQQMSQDLGATLSAARGLVAGPQIKQTLSDVAQASAAMARLAASLDKRVPALADAASRSFKRAGDASDQVGASVQGLSERVGQQVDRTAAQLGTAAERVGAAAGRAESLLAPGSPLYGSVQGAADELTRSATALRAAISDEGASAQSLQRALGDVSRASRALRLLAEQLEQQPQSLIRGREVSP